MKISIKRIIGITAAVCMVFCLTSCMDILQILMEETGSSSSSYNVITAEKSDTWTYDSSRPIHMIDDSVKKLTVYDVPAGKTLYLVMVNPNSYEINSGNLRTITNNLNVASGRTVSDSSGISAVKEPELPEEKFKHFRGEDIPLDLANSSLSRSVVSADSLTAPVCAISGTIGDSKDIYVDIDTGISTFVQKKAHLRAAGTYCYVWVVDDYYTTETSAENKVNSSVAAKFATKFDEMYPYITKIFGSESNEMLEYYNNGITDIVDMTTVSDTGTKINIVIYDIGNDYYSSNECGVLGYFYSKDYRYSTQNRSDIIGKSNKGKYFYVDSAYSVSNIELVISTLAHEFQHMINFNQKDITNLKTAIASNAKGYEVPDTSFNEMLSMLCEDMMQNYLGLDDKDSPIGRLQAFNAYYMVSGIREYLKNNSSLSYSTSYAFGSWLCRQYGGAKLINAMSTSKYVNNEAICNAVNSVTGENKTFDELFEEFLLAVTGTSSYHNTTYTHNQNAKQDLNYSSYYYPMKAFNLWSEKSPDGTQPLYLKYVKVETEDGTTDYYTNVFKDAAYANYDFYGPLVYANNRCPSTLRPEWGMAIQGIESTSYASSKTYNFSSSGAEGLRLYVIIQ